MKKLLPLFALILLTGCFKSADQEEKKVEKVVVKEEILEATTQEHPALGKKILKEGWGIYGSEDLDFSIEYPEESNQGGSVYPTQIFEEDNLITIEQEGQSSGLELALHKLSEESLENFIQNEFGANCSVQIKEDETLNGSISFAAEGTASDDCTPVLGYHFPENKRVVTFGVRQDCVFTGGPHGLCIETEILESIEFDIFETN